MVVLPVRGGATIKPRVPLPMGVTRSMMRVSSRSGVVSRLNFSMGSMRGQVLEAHGLGVILERHVVDLVHGLELRAVAAMRRLGGAGDQAAFAQKTAVDGVGRDKDVASAWDDNGFARCAGSRNPFRKFQDSRNRNWVGACRRCLLYYSYYVNVSKAWNCPENIV